MFAQPDYQLHSTHERKVFFFLELIFVSSARQLHRHSDSWPIVVARLSVSAHARSLWKCASLPECPGRLTRTKMVERGQASEGTWSWHSTNWVSIPTPSNLLRVFKRKGKKLKAVIFFSANNVSQDCSESWINLNWESQKKHNAANDSTHIQNCFQNPRNEFVFFFEAGGSWIHSTKSTTPDSME